MTTHNFRLLSSDVWVDVRLRQIRGRWIASADTPDGPSVGVSWFPRDALRAALQPFHGMVDELMRKRPLTFVDRSRHGPRSVPSGSGRFSRQFGRQRH